MITEPDYGSDALNMRTSYQTMDYAITGRKHWQGLTGQADYWLVAARKDLGNGELARDVDFFVTNNADEKQRIEVEALYSNLGLYMIPYGMNVINVEVPTYQRLQPESTGINMQEKGFRADLVENCIYNMQLDVAQLASNLSLHHHAELVVEYQGESDWLDFL